MAMAICFKCGSAKTGALVACRNCNAAPRANSEYAVSLALSDHLSSSDQLAQYSHELRNGKKLSVPREALVQALDALKDPQLLAMLGAQPSAPSSTTTIGGGTLDVAIAESIGGRVNLLAHGGIAMCGGRDFDRILFDNVVKPWLLDNFDLPEDLASNPQYKSLRTIATWAAEKAKIALSQSEESVISLAENELGVRDQAGEEIYLDIPISRGLYDDLIASKVDESIQATRESIEKAGLSSHDVERIVFVGGPAQYKNLRDKVAFQLGIAPSTDVNPMTAVAEGAAVFAESIDWASQSRGRKSSRGALSAGGTLDLSFNYIARTPEHKAKIVAKLSRAPAGIEFQIDSLDTGWSSGRIALKDGASLELSLSKPGDNIFKVFVFDSNGASVALGEDKIVIARTAASIDAIPASHSIFVEARDRVGGRPIPDYLIREGDQLPKKAKKTFKAEESLKAGSAGSIKFKLWEGEISNPINDNRFIGMFEIKGSDFDDGVIAAGADLICEYEVLDSGNIQLEVSVPSISGSFQSGRNFYSSQEGKIDYSNQAKNIQEQSEHTLERLEEMASKVDDPRLEQAREKLEQANTIESGEADPETAKQAMDNVQEEVLNNLFDDCGGYLCDETGVEAFSGGTHWPFPPRREMNISCFVEVALGPWLDKVRSEVDTPANTLKRELFDVKFRLDCAPNQLLKTWSHQTHSALRGTWDYCQHEGMTSVFVYFTHTISMPPLLSGTSDLYGDTWELSLSVQLMDQDFNGASGWLQICATAVECVPVFSSTPYCPPLDSSAASLDFNVDA